MQWQLKVVSGNQITSLVAIGGDNLKKLILHSDDSFIYQHACNGTQSHCQVMLLLFVSMKICQKMGVYEHILLNSMCYNNKSLSILELLIVQQLNVVAISSTFINSSLTECFGSQTFISCTRTNHTKMTLTN